MIQSTAIEQKPSMKDRVERFLKARLGHHFYSTADHQYLFFLKDVGNVSLLHCLNLYHSTDLLKAECLSELDFSQRTFQVIEYHRPTRELLVVMDEKNTEFVNFHRYNLATQKWTQISHGKNARSHKWSKDRSKFFYIDRAPIAQGLFESRFHCVDLETMEDRTLFVDDKWNYKVGWGGVHFDDLETKVYFQVDEMCRREKFNLVELSLTEMMLAKETLHPEEPAKIFPESIELGNPFLMKDPDSRGYAFSSSHSGFDNWYFLGRKTREITALTQETWKNVSQAQLEDPIHQCSLLTVPDHSKNETLLVRLDFKDLSIQRKTVKGNWNAAFDQGALFIREGAIDQPPRFHLLTSELEIEKTIPLYVGDTSKLVHGTFENITYRSFDGLEISAKLILPKMPARAAMVLAFYGGENYFDFATQLYLEEGIAILSPAVRGSWGWGQEWEDHLKNDLGGKEILDVIWGAKYLEKRLELPATRIGVFGASHGGYATLRAMTMPPKFADVDTTFPFAFGICECGFADLEDFYKTSRIADWLVDLLGPYPEKQALYKERSPLHDFEYLRGPLFVRHGTSDSRVPLSTMTGFLEKLKSGKHHHDVLIQQDQGHHAQNWAVIVNEKERVFQFLKSIKIIE